jgi:hypothetical protein
VQTIIALLRKLFMHDIGGDKSDTVSFLLLSPRSIMTKIRNIIKRLKFASYFPRALNHEHTSLSIEAT